MANYKEEHEHEGGSTPLGCEQWEALLADKMDQQDRLAHTAEVGEAIAVEDLPDADTDAAFARHLRECSACGRLMEQAQQGRQWLKLLDEKNPEVPVYLLGKILEKTHAAGRATDYAIGRSPLSAGGGAAMPLGSSGRWGMPFLPAHGGARDPRLLMTAAMAFFSVALTLSVAGVRLNSVHAAELKPQAVQANMSRSFYGTKKQVVSFYENLRVVYEVESKMRELRRDVDTTPATQSAPVPAAPPSSSGKPKGRGAAANTPAPASEQQPAAAADQQAMRGVPVPAAFAPVQQSPRLIGLVRQAGVQRFTYMLKGAISKERNRI